MTHDEPDEPHIQIKDNGPYRVSGSVPLGRTAQVETEHGEPVGWVPDEPMDDADDVYKLCRCGGSKDKPFCDGSHRTNGFDGTETAHARRSRSDGTSSPRARGR